MLKNVAIPLMLAASEAEAQRAPTKDEVREALEGDLAEHFEGLIADAAACTVASSTQQDNIANLATALSQKTTTHEEAVKAVNDLIAGDWGAANKARKEAVEAAVEKEAEDGIAGLLDDLDRASETERAKAALFVVAERNYAQGLRDQTAADKRDEDATTRLGELADLKKAAADAVTAAKEQKVKEELWRKWRYCELGASVANAAVPDDAKGWWQMVQDTYTPNAPDTCVVPAVPNADGSGNAREAITYYTKVGSNQGELAAESEDGTSQWTAQVKLDTANTALNAVSTMQGKDRTKAGEVAWYTGNLRQKQWTENARSRQDTYYDSINSDRDSAKTIATSMADDNNYDQPQTLTAPFANNEVNNTLMTASAAGALKKVGTETAARDHATTGSGWSMPAARTQSQGYEGWKTTWGITKEGLDSWKTNNTGGNTAGGAYSWWDKARVLTEKVDDWHTHWGTEAERNKLTPGNQAFAESEVKTGSNESATCSEASGTWVQAADVDAQNTGDASTAACKTACENAAVAALFVDVDAGGVDNGGNRHMCKYDAVSITWCGAYSYNNAASAGSKCKFLQNSDSATANASQDDPGDKCANMTTVKAFADLQAAVANAKTDVTSQLLTNLKSAADTQAALEKAYLQAWYLQQYWAQLKVQLTESGNTEDTDYGAKSKLYKDYTTTLKDTQIQTNTSKLGAEAATAAAQTSLNTAQEALATLQANAAAAQALVDGLGTRIKRADTQISELDSLANDAGNGTLDAAAELRRADWEAYGGKEDNAQHTDKSAVGEAVVAAQAKVDADNAVKARTSDDAKDGGSLTEAKHDAQAAWDDAKKETEKAAENLTNALGGAVLATLRETVETDTGKWNDQDKALKKLVEAAEDAEKKMEAAEEARDAAVLACQVAAYDDYRAELERVMVQRATDLKTIKALLETELAEPAPGTAGARCEKALSNGTYRPARGETTCAEGLCCGAARVWMGSGTTADAGWRTVETCQALESTEYMYQPPRAPMATTMPDKVKVAFTCIEGAKKLAAAASAVAAAVYMLA